MQHLKLEQIQRQLEAFAPLLKLQRPRQGWLKLVRAALGRTERQQAGMLGISGPALHKAEKSEAEDRITLGQLRRLADGLECELVYALVPRRPLQEAVQQRAHAIACAEVFSVAHSMELDGRRPAESTLRRQVKRRAEELLSGRWSVLWRD
jgi:predicted DNA-binding mobile mystery protein A